eukprot:3421020-Pleurochrysis_carterae.AAC.1
MASFSFKAQQSGTFCLVNHEEKEHIFLAPLASQSQRPLFERRASPCHHCQKNVRQTSISSTRCAAVGDGDKESTYAVRKLLRHFQEADN